jgi:hypothetical protein
VFRSCRWWEKFCTLGASSCSFSTHNKEVEVHKGHLYLGTGKNSAFAHHHVPSSCLTEDQLETLLQEPHSQQEWVYLIRAVNVQAEAEVVASTRQISVLDAVTPGRKRKDRYDDTREVASVLFTPSTKLKSLGDDSLEGDIVILPSEDSGDLPYEDRIANMVAGWDQVVTTVNKIGVSLLKLKTGVVMDLGDVEGKVLGVDARLGALPPGDVFEDCVTVSDGIALVHDRVKDWNVVFDAHKWAVSQSIASAESRLAQELGRERRALESSAQSNVLQLQQAIQTVADFAKVLSEEQEKLTKSILLRTPSTSFDSGELNTLQA